MAARGGFWSREVDLSFLWRIPRDHPAGVILGAGVILRVFTYLRNRGYWLDEGSLLANIAGKSPLDLEGPLSGDQLAPIGFLIAERLLVGWFGDSGFVTRLIPLACGIGSLWLFRFLALRWLSRPAALAALILFAFSDDLIYYSSELKPYASDLAVSLGVLAAAERVRGLRLGRRAFLGLALLAAAAPWISFPSAFVIAGVGAALLIDRLRQGRRAEALGLAGIAAGWLASLAAAYRASHALLGPATTMYVFWNFAFLAPPPRDAAAWWSFGGVILEVVVNPLNLLPPALPAGWVVVVLALLAAGAIALSRRDPTVLLMLLVPIGLAVAAAAARKYPFHGRLILGLVPAFHLLLAEGLDRIRAGAGRRAFIAAAALVLAYPVWSGLYEASGDRMRDFNAHGDLRRNRFVP